MNEVLLRQISCTEFLESRVIWMHLRWRKLSIAAIIEWLFVFFWLGVFRRVAARADASRPSPEEVLHFLLACALPLTLSRLILVCAQMRSHVLEWNHYRASLDSALDRSFPAIEVLMPVHLLGVLLFAASVWASNAIHGELVGHVDVSELNVLEISEGVATHWASKHGSNACAFHDLRAAVPAQQVCAGDLDWVTWEGQAHCTIEVILGMWNLIVWWSCDEGLIETFIQACVRRWHSRLPLECHFYF